MRNKDQAIIARQQTKIQASLEGLIPTTNRVAEPSQKRALRISIPAFRGKKDVAGQSSISKITAANLASAISTLQTYSFFGKQRNSFWISIDNNQVGGWVAQGLAMTFKSRTANNKPPHSLAKTMNKCECLLPTRKKINLSKNRTNA